MKETNEEIGKIGGIAGEILTFMISKMESNDRKFVDEGLQILTLCLSELIKAGYCKHHYKEAYKKVSRLIVDDLKNEK